LRERRGWGEVVAFGRPAHSVIYIKINTFAGGKSIYFGFTFA